MKVRINTSARLHLGFYNFRKGDRVYGSIGVAIDKPVLDVVIEPLEEKRIEVVSRQDIEDVIRRVKQVFNVGARIYVHSYIPRHVGLGSTTQLALAIGVGLSLITQHQAEIDVYDIAAKLGRGLVSGIGVATFKYGGFVVDCGRRVYGDRLELPRSASDVPQPIIQHRLPKDWRFIVIVPRTSKPRVSEDRELQIMQPPANVPETLQYELYAALLLEMLPALWKGDIEGFGKALTRIQILTGKFFEPLQGGVFCCRETEAVIKVFNELGVYGYGQSSWGPVAYGLVDIDRSERVFIRCMERLKELGIDVEYATIATPRNDGAKIYLV